MNGDLRDAFTDDYNDVESFVTFSLDASNIKDYTKIHDIAPKKKDKLGNISSQYFDFEAAIVFNAISDFPPIIDKFFFFMPLDCPLATSKNKIFIPLIF